MRAFIAAEVQRFFDLDALVAEIEGIPRSRPVKTETLHMTFIFLGELDSASLNGIVLSLSGVQLRRFPLKIMGIGFFPDPHRARIAYLNVVSNPEIEEDYRLIRKSVGPGFDAKGQFVPHITIGRFRSPVNLAGLMEKYSWIRSDQEIREVGIFSSTLTLDGPVYRPIATFQLK